MRRKIELDSVSLGVGAVAALAVVVLVGMTPQASVEPMISDFAPFIRVSGTISVKGVPQAKDMVRIDPLQTYVVPTGKLLVITGIGATGGGYQVSVWFDGTKIVEGGGIPPGLMAPAGTNVNAGTGGSAGATVIFGYLEDA